MTTENLKSAIESLKQQFEEGTTKYSFYGVRFDSRDLNPGDKLGKSKSNINREDVRDFPEYGTEEYNSLLSLGGTCAYFVFDGDTGRESLGLPAVLKMIESDWMNDNWYLVGANDATGEEEDENEIVLVDARVICKL